MIYIMKLNFTTGNFIEFKTKIRKAYPQLTDEDLSFADGKEDQMLRIIAYKLRLSKYELQKIISGL
jgi:hypothetical protein